MGAQLAVAGAGAVLHHGELGEPALVVGGELGAQHVQPGGLQPLRAPPGQVAAGGLLQRAQQVAQGRVAPRVPLEVHPQPGQEVLQPHVGHQLLEHRGALGVGDAVEVDLDRLQVRDVGGDRVRGRHLVLPVCPGLLHAGERGPRGGVVGAADLGEHAGPGRERLVQPQVVPPAHGDQVAEPHVRHLVQHRLAAALVEVAGDLRPEDEVLQERHAAGVLHRSGVELGHEALVVLAERVRHAERLVVEGESLLGLAEQPLGVQVLGQRGAAVQAQRDRVLAVLAGELVAPLRVRPGDQRDQVGRHRLGGAEGVRAAAVGVGDLGGGVGDDLPVGGGVHRDLVGGLQVRLVEAGEHPLRVGGLELAVEVDRAVDRVDEPVQALAGVGVLAVGFDDELVVRGQSGQPQPLLLAVVGDVQLDAVEPGAVHLRGDQVDPRLGPRLRAAEPDRGGGAEGPHFRPAPAVGEVQFDHVGLDVQQRGALPGLVLGEVRRGQRITSSLVGS